MPDDDPRIDPSLRGGWRFTFLGGHEGEDLSGAALRLDGEQDGGSLRLPGHELGLRVTEAVGGTGGAKPGVRFTLHHGEEPAGDGELRLKRENAGRGRLTIGGTEHRFTAEREPEAAADDPFVNLALHEREGVDFSEMDREHTDLLERFSREMLGLMTDAMPMGHFHEVARDLGVARGKRIEENPREQAVLFEHAMFDLPLDSDGPSHAQQWLTSHPPAEEEGHERVCAAVGRARWSVVEIESAAPGRGVVVEDLLHGERLAVTDARLSRSPVGKLVVARLLPLDGFASVLGVTFELDPEGFASLQKRMEALANRSGIAHVGVSTTRRLVRSTLQDAFDRRIIGG